MKRLVIVIIPILVAALFAGYLWWALGNVEVNEMRWLALDPAKVASLKMERGDDGFACIRTKTGWDIRVVAARGDVLLRTVPDSVNRLLKSIADIKPLRSFTIYSHSDHSIYGLEDPVLRFTLSYVAAGASKGEPVVIAFGKQKTSGRVFAWNSQAPKSVFELSQNVLPQLADPAEKYYDVRLFNLAEEPVTRIQLVQPFGSNWMVEKQGEGFVFQLPGYLKDRPAADSQIEIYVHMLANIRADSLAPDTEVEGDPVLTIRVWTKDAKNPRELMFYKPRDDKPYMLGRSTWQPVPFLLDTESVGQLTRSVFDIQGRNVLKLDSSKVRLIRLTNANQVFQLDRTDNGWRDSESQKEVLGIDMSLWRFTELQFESLPLKALPESAAWLMNCKLMDEDDGVLADLSFYADSNLPPGQSWLQNGTGMFYPVSSKLVQDLQGLFPVRSVETNQ